MNLQSTVKMCRRNGRELLSNEEDNTYYRLTKSQVKMELEKLANFLFVHVVRWATNSLVGCFCKPTLDQMQQKITVWRKLYFDPQQIASLGISLIIDGIYRVRVKFPSFIRQRIVKLRYFNMALSYYLR